MFLLFLFFFVFFFSGRQEHEIFFWPCWTARIRWNSMGIPCGIVGLRDVFFSVSTPIRWIWPNILTYEKQVLSCVELQIIIIFWPFISSWMEPCSMYWIWHVPSCTLQIIKSVRNLSAIWLQTISIYSRPQPTPLLVEGGFPQILPSLSIGNDDVCHHHHHHHHHHHDQIHHHYQQQQLQQQQQQQQQQQHNNNNDHCQHHHDCHYFVSIRFQQFQTPTFPGPVRAFAFHVRRLSGGKIADGWGD